MARKPIAATREYRGVTIWHERGRIGHALPWTARTERGPLAADTLAGIKTLIREALA